MKRFTKIVFLLLIPFGLTNCEKDDICDPNLTTTPRLIIEFFSVVNPSVPRDVTNLAVKAPEVEESMLFTGTNKIAIPLKTFTNTTTFVFTLNSGATNGSLNEDVVTFNYNTEDIYVSRACGFKTYYDLFSQQGQGIQITPDSNNWIKDPTILRTKIDSENDVHIKLFF
jgi:hypothetical protein